MELTLKALSAVGLLLLGIAGTLLQWRTEETRQAAAKFANDSRVVLPSFRVLTDLELVIGDVLKEVQAGNDLGAETESELRSRLTATALSTLILDQPVRTPIKLASIRDSDQHALTSLEVHAHYYSSATQVSLDVSVHDSALMLSDIAEVLAYVESSKQFAQSAKLPSLQLASVSFENYTHTNRAPYGPVADLWSEDHKLIAQVPAHAESIAFWKVWGGSDPVHIGNLQLSEFAIANAIRQQTVIAVATLMRANPMLGDKFVAIRSEAIEQHFKINRK